MFVRIRTVHEYILFPAYFHHSAVSACGSPILRNPHMFTIFLFCVSGKFSFLCFSVRCMMCAQKLSKHVGFYQFTYYYNGWMLCIWYRNHYTVSSNNIVCWDLCSSFNSIKFTFIKKNFFKINLSSLMQKKWSAVKYLHLSAQKSR